MEILILFAFLSFIGSFVYLVDGMLFSVITFLVLPVLHYNLSILSLEPINAYCLELGIIFLIATIYKYYIQKQRTFFEYENLFMRLENFIIFSCFFLFFYLLALKWPDFYSLGERMRDLALIGAGVRDPIYIQEPWMSGVGLNYYAYWYRFANILSTFLNFKHWQIYHVMVALAPSLFGVFSCQLLRDLFKIKKIDSILLSLLLLLGSNPAGIYYFFTSNQTWWYPSRVVDGTIHEFPAWSFLLGDAHPHFLNSFALTLFLYLSYLLLRSGSNYISAFIACSLIPCLYMGNANLWELPIWMLALVVFLFVFCVHLYFNQDELRNGIKSLRKINIYFFISLFFICVLAFMLYRMKSNFVPIPSEAKLVKDPVRGSAASQFFMHWGFFLLPMTFSLIAQAKKSKIIWIVFLTVSLFYQSILLFLIILLLLALERLFEVLKNKVSLEVLFSESILLLAISLLLVPEVVYLDDPYGADIERMNTFFKISYANWAIMFYATCYLIYRFLNTKLIVFSSFIFCMFFFAVIPQRVMEWSDPRGLDFLDRKYPGVKSLVLFLESSVPETIIEAQGPPYSETSLVATLSNFPAYLGWINHLDLLMPDKRDEIARRNKLTESIYGNQLSCSEKKASMNSEGIQYLVVGSLENKTYVNLSEIDYSCFMLKFDSKDYKLYSVS